MHYRKNVLCSSFFLTVPLKRNGKSIVCIINCLNEKRTRAVNTPRERGKWKNATKSTWEIVIDSSSGYAEVIVADISRKECNRNAIHYSYN